MSTFTCDSRIKGKTEITHTLDAARVNPCKVHGTKPRFYVITWGSGKRHQQGATAECESEDCLCFESSALDVVSKWNRFNPAAPAPLQ